MSLSLELEKLSLSDERDRPASPPAPPTTATTRTSPPSLPILCDDVLHQIFEHLARERTSPSYPSRLTLLLVCKHWTSLATPLLEKYLRMRSYGQVRSWRIHLKRTGRRWKKQHVKELFLEAERFRKDGSMGSDESAELRAMKDFVDTLASTKVLWLDFVNTFASELLLLLQATFLRSIHTFKLDNLLGFVAPVHFLNPHRLIIAEFDLPLGRSLLQAAGTNLEELVLTGPLSFCHPSWGPHQVVPGLELRTLRYFECSLCTARIFEDIKKETYVEEIQVYVDAGRAAEGEEDLKLWIAAIASRKFGKLRLLRMDFSPFRESAGVIALREACHVEGIEFVFFTRGDELATPVDTATQKNVAQKTARGSFKGYALNTWVD
ncbi:hypothetical protein MNV49_002184 [Pseudohyphozyma bogoriensis]|nr:hypothetical protein MNV49_002184 [Pseudohyphozyma bogoriensis]